MKLRPASIFSRRIFRIMISGESSAYQDRIQKSACALLQHREHEQAVGWPVQRPSDHLSQEDFAQKLIRFIFRNIISVRPGNRTHSGNGKRPERPDQRPCNRSCTDSRHFFGSLVTLIERIE